MPTPPLDVTEVIPGLVQVRMPLPFRLNHINLYLIEDADGWILVDTGLNTPTTQSIWQEFLSSSFFSKPIKTIFVTHLHPDHIGMAAWLSCYLQIPVHIPADDWQMANQLWQNDSPEASIRYQTHWQGFGVPSDRIEELMQFTCGYKNLVKTLPASVIPCDGTEVFQSLVGPWQCLPAKGHSPLHLCLYNSDTQLLISGDHILPTITPNISIHPIGPQNPLEEYLSSLQGFSRLACARYLPAHGPICDNLSDRIADINLHHHQKFANLLDQLPLESNVHMALEFMFPQHLAGQQLMFAYGETAAHLRYLANRDLLACTSPSSWQFTNPRAAARENPSKFQPLDCLNMS